MSPAIAAEQLLYEIGDPAAYALPDVVCDFTEVAIGEAGPDRVHVSGARGTPPSGAYKVTATYPMGFQLALMMAIRGLDAPAKAERTARELLGRTRRLMAEAGYGDYSDTLVECLGAEAIYGPHSRIRDCREIVLRLAVQHPDRKALDFLRKEASSAGTAMGPGTRSHFGGRSAIQPVIGVASCFIPKERVEVVVRSPSREARIVAAAAAPGYVSRPPAPPPAEAGARPAEGGRAARIALSRIAHGRSGDKGRDANIGIIAREERWWPVLRDELTPDRVRAYFGHLMTGAVHRYELPGLKALNFVLEDALGGGGSSSLRSDPLGKCYAQMLLDLEIPCPEHLLASTHDNNNEGRTS